MTLHWQILVLKGGKRVRLFTMTTTSMIDLDLSGDPEKSLIRSARQYHRHGQNEKQNHRDLAIGAIMAFAGIAPYDISDTHVEPCESVPPAEKSHYVGGKHGDSLVPIWEESSESEA